MKKEEVLNSLKLLSSRLIDRKYVTLKEVRSIPKLDYYIHYYFRGLGNALRAAGLPSSKLASSMSIKSEDLLNYLRDLRSKLTHNPTVWDIQDDNEIYKRYSGNKFSWAIFKTRFKGLRKATEQMNLMDGTVTKNKSVVEVTMLKREEAESFQHKNRYFGKAAELHVTAELIYHGFQATNIPIDVGLDILAIKNNKTFYFQVKHKDLNTNLPIRLRRSTFERSGGGDVYYVFVLLLERKREFLIVPFHIVSDWIREDYAEEKEGDYLIFIKKEGNDYKLKNLPLNKYLDRWEDIK